MSNPRKYLFLAGMLLSSSALAMPSAPAGQASRSQPAFDPGNQYTATLDQTRNQWRLQPADGQDVVIDIGDCATGATVPSGFWLLVSDSKGQPELLAPSITRLPAGHPDRVELRACDKAHGRQLAVPQILLDMLSANTGAIHVDN